MGLLSGRPIQAATPLARECRQAVPRALLLQSRTAAPTLAAQVGITGAAEVRAGHHSAPVSQAGGTLAAEGASAASVPPALLPSPRIVAAPAPARQEGSVEVVLVTAAVVLLMVCPAGFLMLFKTLYLLTPAPLETKQ